MRKPTYRIRENKGADPIRTFVFALKIVLSLFFLKLKFQPSSFLLWLYSPVCVRPGRKPLLVFSHTGSDNSIVIKKADKGSTVVIMNRDDYIAEVERQLNNS